MSEEICHRDQDRLDYIFEQVKALSNVVDELRIEVNNLKKVSLRAKREDISFECTKVNCKISHVEPCVVDNVKTYFRNVKDLAETEKIHQLSGNSQVPKSDSTSASYIVQSKIEKDEELPSCKSPPVYFINQTTLSTIYGGLKSFKNRLVKIIHSVPGAQLFLKNAKNSCVEFNEQQQIPRKEEKRKFPEFNEANENDVSKCININGKLDDSTDSLTSDTSTQVDITCSCQEDDKKSTYRNITENNVQASPLISDNRLIVRSSWITDQTSKGPVKRVFFRNKPKKYKICSCGSQCPYTLYKLPCCDQNNVPKKETNDEVNGLMLECSSFEEKNNFPKFVNIDPGEEECLSDFEANESLISSLSVDLELDVCGDYDKLEKEFIDESSKQRNMNHVVKGTSVRRNDNAISHFRTENKPPICINLEANHQEYRPRTEDFTRDYRPIRSNDKQVQCSSATLRATRRVPVKTSTLDFWQSGSTNRSRRATETTRGINFLKEITPKRMKINVHTQTEKHSYFNRLQNIDLSPALNFGNKRKHRENIEEDENKRVSHKRNICDICDLPRQKSWSRMDTTHSSHFRQRKLTESVDYDHLNIFQRHPKAIRNK